MTPKEKAKQLVDNMMPFVYIDKSIGQYFNGKHCALIAVNEIIESSPLDPNDAEEWLQPADWFSDANISAEKYWIEVKKEIEAL